MNDDHKFLSKRSINGIVVLDKPIGITSNAALQKVKRLFNAKKAGHTGSLDPLANGVLPICFGEATKFSQYLLDADKAYFVKIKLGIRTNTADAEGEVIENREVQNYRLEQINSVFNQFRGEIDQVPPMFSALKHNGQPLYKLARQGITVERKSRRITIYSLNVLSFEKDSIVFEVKCSKGTYIRTLVDDFGEVLGCGAHVLELQRIQVGPYQLINSLTFDKLIEQHKKNGYLGLYRYLLPVETSVRHYPIVQIEPNIAFCLQQGRSVRISDAPISGWVQLLQMDGQFLGVGEVLANGQVAPRRLIRSEPRT